MNPFNINIFVSKLSYHTTDDDLFHLFSQFGLVESARVIKDRETGRSKGFGFVIMEDHNAGMAAIVNLHESELQGRKIAVQRAVEHKK